MQPTTSSFLTPLALKTAGAVLIVSSLIDLVFMLLFPPELTPDPDGKRWWLYATSQIVDRGLLPLVGIAFVIAGDWIQIVSTEDGGSRGNSWRIGTYTLASLLGLIFVVVIPFQLMTTNNLKTDDLKKIGDEVTRLEQSIKSNLQQISAQPKDKIKEQIAAVDKEIKNGAQGQGLTNLQITKSKLETLLNDPGKFKQESEQNLKQLNEQKRKAESQANEKMLKTGVRTGFASLLLALAYVTIGWTGLRGVLK
jgi:hypothetical protein